MSLAQTAALSLVLHLYLVVSIFSLIYAARMLSRPGISAEIRQIFMRKHVLYNVAFIILWTITLLEEYDALYNRHFDHVLDPRYEQSSNTLDTNFGVNKTNSLGEPTRYRVLRPLQIVSFIASISIRPVMGVIRCMEPYFMLKLEKTLKSYYGIPMPDEEVAKKSNKLTDTISAFLNSSLNIEFVHIILEAITHLGENREMPQ